VGPPSLLFVLRHPATPLPIRLQAARTLYDTLAIVPRNTLWQLQVISKQQLRSVACWTFWHNRSCWVGSHRARAWSPAAWALRRCTRFCKHQVIPRWLGTIYSRCSVASARPPFRPCFAIKSFLARPRAPPLGYLQERGHSALIKITFRCMTLNLCAMLSPLFRPSSRVSASAGLGSLVGRWTRISPWRQRGVSSGASRTRYRRSGERWTTSRRIARLWMHLGITFMSRCRRAARGAHGHDSDSDLV
jgi:hypothetical protein